MLRAFTLACAVLLSLGGTTLSQEDPTPVGFALCAARYHDPIQNKDGNADGCAQKPSAISAVTETAETLPELVAVNRYFNDVAIRYEDDYPHYLLRDYWTVPQDGYGDCEDYALAKKAFLEKKGYPSGSLLLAQVYDDGVRHVVLEVVTDRHTYILDSPVGASAQDRERADIVRTAEEAKGLIFDLVQDQNGLWHDLHPNVSLTIETGGVIHVIGSR